MDPKLILILQNDSGIERFYIQNKLAQKVWIKFYGETYIFYIFINLYISYAEHNFFAY